MKIKTPYQKYSPYISFKNFIYILSIICLSISTITFLSSISDNKNSSFDWTNNGYEYFLNLYSFSIKSFGAFLVLLTIFLTLKRMEQTQEQIDLIKKQNSITNYYITKEKFEDYFLRSKFKEILDKIAEEFGIRKFDKTEINNLFNYSFDVLENFSLNTSKKFNSLIEELNNIPLNKKFTHKMDENELMMLIDDDYMKYLDTSLPNLSSYYYEYIKKIVDNDEKNNSNRYINNSIDLINISEYFLSIMFTSKTIFLVSRFMDLNFKEPRVLYVNVFNLIKPGKKLAELKSFSNYFSELSSCY